MPVMLVAARRFLEGNGVKANLGVAYYYWIIWAEVAHGDVATVMDKPHERLIEQMSDEEKVGLLHQVLQFGDLEFMKSRGLFCSAAVGFGDLLADFDDHPGQLSDAGFCDPQFGPR